MSGWRRKKKRNYFWALAVSCWFSANLYEVLLIIPITWEFTEALRDLNICLMSCRLTRVQIHIYLDWWFHIINVKAKKIQYFVIKDGVTSRLQTGSSHTGEQRPSSSSLKCFKKQELCVVIVNDESHDFTLAVGWIPCRKPDYF